jgi:hypothetical protein
MTTLQHQTLLFFIDTKLKPLMQKAGLIGPKDKPLTKTAFFKLAKPSLYTGNRRKSYIFFVHNERNNIFGFYPPMNITLKESKKIAYEYYLTMFESTDTNEFYYGNVCWGNCGIPLSYSKLRIQE